MKYYIVLLAVVVCLCAIAYRYWRKDVCSPVRIIETEDGIIEIVDPACQEGLPHTSDSNTIRMTESAYADSRSATTLKHERVHLDQKRNPAVWYEFYRRFWEYDVRQEPPYGIPKEYVKQLRPNPDTADKPWAVWRNRWVFFPTYGPNTTLRKADVRVWDLNTERFTSPPPEWRAMFCVSNTCPHQYEHPHELAAEYIAEGHQSDAAVKLFNWKH